MIDNRDYEKDPQSEQEIESARNIINPNLSQEYKPKITQMSSSIRGFKYSDEEKKDMENEEYRNRKHQIEVREFLTRTFIFKNLMSVKAPDRTIQDSPFLIPGRTRLAESDKDFKEIFDREFLRSGSKENVRDIYAERMIEKIEKLTAYYLDFTSKNELLEHENLELINSARRFVDFLKEMIAIKPEIEIVNHSNLGKNADFKQADRLESIFESVSKYKKIMEILVDKKLAAPHTYSWIDSRNGTKKYLATLIKDLHGKGYYKDNLMPSNEQIVSICKNTFWMKLGIDTVKRTRTGDFNFQFIPIASTIK